MLPLASVLVLAALVLAPPVPAQVPIPAIDLYDLVRSLLSRRGRGDAPATKEISLQDQASGRKASLRISDEGDSLVLVVTFPTCRERLFAHTIRITTDAGATLVPQIMKLDALSDEGEGEVLVALLELDDLDLLADATTLQVTIQGWDETFASTLDAKEIEKIRRYRDRVRGLP